MRSGSAESNLSGKLNEEINNLEREQVALQKEYEEMIDSYATHRVISEFFLFANYRSEPPDIEQSRRLELLDKIQSIKAKIRALKDTMKENRSMSLLEKGPRSG